MTWSAPGRGHCQPEAWDLDFSPPAAAALLGVAVRPEGNISGLPSVRHRFCGCTLTLGTAWGLLGKGVLIWFQICKPHPGFEVWSDVDRAGRVGSLERPTLTRNPAAATSPSDTPPFSSEPALLSHTSSLPFRAPRSPCSCCCKVGGPEDL